MTIPTDLMYTHGHEWIRFGAATLCESNTDVLVDRPTSLSAWTRAPWRYRSRPALGQG